VYKYANKKLNGERDDRKWVRFGGGEAAACDKVRVQNGKGKCGGKRTIIFVGLVGDGEC